MDQTSTKTLSALTDESIPFVRSYFSDHSLKLPKESKI